MGIFSGGAGTGVSALGVSTLVYRKTIAGVDAASIDTGVDSPDSGSNDWTNADLLEINIMARTDDAAIFAFFDMTINNDTSGSYDWYANLINGAALGISSGFADTRWQMRVHGTSGQSYPAYYNMAFSAYTRTDFKKAGSANAALIEASTGNAISGVYSLGNRNTTAITRLKIAAQAAAKFKVGSQLLIYKRRNV